MVWANTHGRDKASRGRDTYGDGRNNTLSAGRVIGRPRVKSYSRRKKKKKTRKTVCPDLKLATRRYYGRLRGVTVTSRRRSRTFARAYLCAASEPLPLPDGLMRSTTPWARLRFVFIALSVFTWRVIVVGTTRLRTGARTGRAGNPRMIDPIGTLERVCPAGPSRGTRGSGQCNYAYHFCFADQFFVSYLEIDVLKK